MESFAAFHFVPPILQAVQEAGYTTPTPIQTQAIPLILKGHDVSGIAQTGTGKTAAFVLPILNHIALHPKVLPKGTPRVLMLAPTRELAAQIDTCIRTYGKHLRVTSLAIFGGVAQGPQTHALSKSIDIIIATPGRLRDLMGQGFVHLGSIETLVLDEADRMLAMGFADDIKFLAQKTPHNRQTLLFSATFSGQIAVLANSYLRNPVKIAVTAEATTVGKTVQTVLFVDKEDKAKLLLRILAAEDVKRAIVFMRMKHTADKAAAKLIAAGIAADALHSDKTQTMRTEIVEKFRAGKLRVLVATDIAARGLDVDDVTHVINYDLPKDAETYVHRIGRTARAGAAGTAISFCSGEERNDLTAIERLIGKKLTVKEHKYSSTEAQNGGVIKSTAKNTLAPPRTGKGGGRAKLHKARQTKGWKQK